MSKEEILDGILHEKECPEPFDILTASECYDAMERYAQQKTKEAIEKKAVIGIIRYMCGYTDFPQRKVGDGAYYWRSILRDKFSEIGITAEDIETFNL